MTSFDMMVAQNIFEAATTTKGRIPTTTKVAFLNVELQVQSNMVMLLQIYNT